MPSYSVSSISIFILNIAVLTGQATAGRTDYGWTDRLRLDGQATAGRTGYGWTDRLRLDGQATAGRTGYGWTDRLRLDDRADVLRFPGAAREFSLVQNV